MSHSESSYLNNNPFNHMNDDLLKKINHFTKYFQEITKIEQIDKFTNTHEVIDHQLRQISVFEKSITKSSKMKKKVGNNI